MFNKVIISKSNLIHNIKQVKLNNPNAKVCAMVKANAYGVGAKQVVSCLSDYVDYFGVACFFEAKNILPFTNKNILIVGPLEYGALDKRFYYTVSSIEDVKFLIEQNKPIKVHLKINSGMNRYGFSNMSQFKQSLKMLKNSCIIVEGVFTHFATTDNYINEQMFKFEKYVRMAKKYFSKLIVHADNSIVSEIKNHNLDMVRIGFSLYAKNECGFKSVLKIKTKIVQINWLKKRQLAGYNYRFVAKKKTKVAVIPVGYADGLGLEYLGFELNVDGQKCKILNICMDCAMIDITKTNLKKGDDLYLLSKDNLVSNFASYEKISEYQVMTNFSHIRAERIIEN